MSRAAPASNLRFVVLLWLAGLGAAAQYGKVSVVFDLLPGLYPDAGGWLGFTVSLVGLVGILLGVTAGLLVARIRYRRALIWGLAAGAVVSLYQATLPALPLFLLSRVVEGMSHLVIVVAAPTLIAQLATDRERGFALTLWGTFFGVAFSVLVWGGLPLVGVFGLSGLFLAHALYMAAFAVVIGLFLPRAQAEEVSTDLTPGAILRRHAVIYRSPRISAPAMGWLFYTLAFVSILTLLPPYVAPEVRSLVIGAMPLVSIASSLGIGVWLLRRITAVRLMEVGFALSALAALALAAAPGQPALCLVLAACLGLVQGAGFAAVPQLNDTAADRAAANGAMAQTGNIGNTLGTPLLLAVATLSGHAGMMIAAALVLAAGLAGQIVLTRRRAAQF